VSIALLTCTVVSVTTTWFFVVRGDRLRAAGGEDSVGSGAREEISESESQTSKPDLGSDDTKATTANAGSNEIPEKI
jgi:hypothetical protein